MRDLKSNINVVKAVAPATISTDTTNVSAIIDLLAYNAACILLYTGAYTAGTFTLTVEHGDDSALSDTASAALFLDHDSNAGVVAAANKYARTGLLPGIKRYIRITITSTSTGAGAVVGCAVIEGRPLDAPVAD